jgi:hypothetical protein
MRCLGLAILVACGDPDTDRDDTAADTAVIAPGDPYAAWLGSLGSCTPKSGDGRLDLRRACADGVCSGDRYERFVDTFGPPECYRGLYGLAACAFPAGITSFFDDPDSNLVIEPQAPARVLWVLAPYDGTSTDGLGVGSSISCFVQTLGTPGEVTIDPSPVVSGDSVTWYDPYVSVTDGGNGVSPDQRVDALFLGGD